MENILKYDLLVFYLIQKLPKNAILQQTKNGNTCLLMLFCRWKFCHSAIEHMSWQQIEALQRGWNGRFKPLELLTHWVLWLDDNGEDEKEIICKDKNMAQDEHRNEDEESSFRAILMIRGVFLQPPPPPFKFRVRKT